MVGGRGNPVAAAIAAIGVGVHGRRSPGLANSRTTMDAIAGGSVVQSRCDRDDDLGFGAVCSSGISAVRLLSVLNQTSRMASVQPNAVWATVMFTV